jgi:hypothetical protein
MLFEYLKDLTQRKKGDLPLANYIPYIINRWISFGLPGTTSALNESVNIFSTLTKEEHYKLLLTCLPQMKYAPRFKYLKKVKKEKDEEDDKINMLARNMELSKREIQQLLDQNEMKKA